MGNSANDDATGRDELSGGPGVRVDELLALPEFAGTVVVAGREGLDRVVSRANVMEVPDIEAWVKPRELLLTTGYPLREVPHGLVRLVAALDEAGVSALAVKLHRYLDELPADMIEAADRARLPLLLLPDPVAFDDLLNAVVTEVVNRQASLLELGEAIDHTLIPLVLRGGGLTELVSTLADVIDALTFVTTTDGRVLATTLEDATPALSDDDDLFVDSGRFRSERFAPGVHRVGDSTVAVALVLAGATDHGRLVVVRRRGSLTASDLRLLERAATVAALVITKELAVQAVEAKYRGDFVRDVLLDRAGARDVVLGHFQSLGWHVDRPLVVVVAAIDPLTGDQESPAVFRASQDRFANAWVDAVSRYDRSSPVVGFAQEVVALIGLDGQPPRELVAGLVQRVSGDGGGGRRSFASGVSRVIAEPGQISAGYEQARRAVHVGRQLQGPSAVAHFDDLGAFRLLSLIDDAHELRNFVAEVLGELADEIDPVASDMRATLRVLLDTNFNVAESSRRLHFHYNTLRYRIGKLEQLLGPFTEDPDLQLDLALALRVIQMRDL